MVLASAALWFQHIWGMGGAAPRRDARVFVEFAEELCFTIIPSGSVRAFLVPHLPIGLLSASCQFLPCCPENMVPAGAARWCQHTHTWGASTTTIRAHRWNCRRDVFYIHPDWLGTGIPGVSILTHGPRVRHVPRFHPCCPQKYGSSTRQVVVLAHMGRQHHGETQVFSGYAEALCVTIIEACSGRAFLFPFDPRAFRAIHTISFKGTPVFPPFAQVPCLRHIRSQCCSYIYGSSTPRSGVSIWGTSITTTRTYFLNNCLFPVILLVNGGIHGPPPSTHWSCVRHLPRFPDDCPNR